MPGLRPAHSNTAGHLLGIILENIYGISYEALLKKYITIPMDMGNTYVNVPSSKKLLYTQGYNDKEILMPTDPKDAGGAGILKSSLDDMTSYLHYQLKENDNAVKLSHTPTWGDPDNYSVGLNWSIKKNFDDMTKIWTSGGTFGYSSYIVLYPQRNFGIVILSNEDDEGAEDRLSNLTQNIYDNLFFTATQRSAEGFGFSSSINTLSDSLNKYGFENAIKIVNNLRQSKREFKLTEDELNYGGTDSSSRIRNQKH